MLGRNETEINEQVILTCNYKLIYIPFWDVKQNIKVQNNKNISG